METIRVHTRKCIQCGKRGTVEHVPYEGWHNWKAGVPIQQALPELSVDDREQLMTGTHPDCWDLLYPEDEDEGMDLEIA